MIDLLVESHLTGLGLSFALAAAGSCITWSFLNQKVSTLYIVITIYIGNYQLLEDGSSILVPLGMI